MCLYVRMREFADCIWCVCVLFDAPSIKYCTVCVQVIDCCCEVLHIDIAHINVNVHIAYCVLIIDVFVVA